MTDWTTLLHSIAGAIVGAGAALTGQLIMAANNRSATKQSAHYDHRKWARDLAAQAHDGFIVEFERLTPFYGISEGPLAPDWMTGLHLKLQRMRLVCSRESVALAHAAMHALERYNESSRYTDPSTTAWQPVQAAFDNYLDGARRDLGLIHHQPEPLSQRVLERAHVRVHHGAPVQHHAHHAHAADAPPQIEYVEIPVPVTSAAGNAQVGSANGATASYAPDPVCTHASVPQPAATPAQ